MPSAQTRQNVSTLVVVVLGLGAAGFAAFWLFPLIGTVRTSYDTVQDELQTLNKRSSSSTIPSQGTIKQYKSSKEDMVAQAERAASFYLRQNQKLNKKILESWRMDEYELAIRFRELKNRLAQKAGNPDFLELGKADDWEKKERGKPDKATIHELEKKSSIGSVLVDALTDDKNTVIELMEIGDPQPPANAPPTPNVNWMIVRYRTFPVNVSFSTNFSSLGKTMHRLVTVPKSTSDRPCMRVRQLQIQSTDGNKVNVNLVLDVFDFHEVTGEG